MSTATIINNIQKLPLVEQFLIVEQVLKSIYNAEQKQAGLAKIPEGYISLDEFRKLVHEDTEKFCAKYGIN